MNLRCDELCAGDLTFSSGNNIRSSAFFMVLGVQLIDPRSSYDHELKIFYVEIDIDELRVYVTSVYRAKDDPWIDTPNEFFVSRIT